MSNVPKCTLNNGLSIVQKPLVKLSNVSITFSQTVDSNYYDIHSPLLFETLLQIISVMSQLNGLAISDKMNCISGVMVRVLAFSVIDCGL